MREGEKMGDVAAAVLMFSFCCQCGLALLGPCILQCACVCVCVCLCVDTPQDHTHHSHLPLPRPRSQGIIHTPKESTLLF